MHDRAKRRLGHNLEFSGEVPTQSIDTIIDIRDVSLISMILYLQSYSVRVSDKGSPLSVLSVGLSSASVIILAAHEARDRPSSRCLTPVASFKVVLIVNLDPQGVSKKSITAHERNVTCNLVPHALYAALMPALLPSTRQGT